MVWTHLIDTMMDILRFIEHAGDVKRDTLKQVFNLKFLLKRRAGISDGFYYDASKKRNYIFGI